MGLEYTELIMACEEEFSVIIEPTREEMAGLETVGGLSQYIFRLLQGRRTYRCPNVPIFFAVRDSLVNLELATKSQIKPSTRLVALFPFVGRRRAWRMLQQSARHRLPSLYPIAPLFIVGWVAILLGIPIAFFSFFAVMLIFESVELAPAGYLVFPLFVFALPALLYIAWAALVVRGLPVSTVGELVENIVAREGLARAPGEFTGDCDDVWQRLRPLVALRLDVAEIEIRPDTHFWKDLGVG